MSDAKVEPWLRGTLTEIDPVRRQVLHALELAAEDAARWCDGLTLAEMNARPAGVAPVAYHLRHIARSLDRLLTYAEGEPLRDSQHRALATELDPAAEVAVVMAEFTAGMATAVQRIRSIPLALYDAPRGVGRQQLPTTVAGLLIHCAEHTQRHIGQAITTAKIVRGASA